MERQTTLRYILSLAVIFITWIFGSLAVSAIIRYAGTLPAGSPLSSLAACGTPGSYDLSCYISMHLGFAFMLAGILISVRFILCTPITKFLTDAPFFRIGRGLKAMILWIACMAVLTLAENLVIPGTIYRNLAGSHPGSQGTSQFFLFASVSICLVTIQASSEEMLFRTLPGRFLSLYTPGKSIPALFSGLLFTLVHIWNPEIHLFNSSPAIYLYYFLFGFLLMYISLADGGYELAMGIHIGNNLFSSILLNYEGSVMPTPALFMAQTGSAWMALLFSLLAFLAVWLLLSPGKPRNKQGNSQSQA